MPGQDSGQFYYNTASRPGGGIAVDSTYHIGKIGVKEEQPDSTKVDQYVSIILKRLIYLNNEIGLATLPPINLSWLEINTAFRVGSVLELPIKHHTRLAASKRL